jgi:hypothetical protein
VAGKKTKCGKASPQGGAGDTHPLPFLLRGAPAGAAAAMGSTDFRPIRSTRTASVALLYLIASAPRYRSTDLVLRSVALLYLVARQRTQDPGTEVRTRLSMRALGGCRTAPPRVGSYEHFWSGGKDDTGWQAPRGTQNKAQMELGVCSI